MLRSRATDRNGRRCGSRRTSGQALVETVIALTIILTIVIGLINLAMIASTRHVLNFAAFSASRASVYGGTEDAYRAGSIVRTITDALPRGTQVQAAGPRKDGGTDDYVVTVWAPFGYPFSGMGGRSLVTSKAPLYQQRDIKEAGDNAR